MTRFDANYIPEPNTGCWLWIGPTGRGGYGRFYDGHRTLGAPRWAYQQAKGEIPAGLVLDHKCRVRCCVNPDHLEAVTNQENVDRGLAAAGRPRPWFRKTHCPQGHALTPDNVYTKRPGWIECRICRRAAKRDWWHRRKEPRNQPPEKQPLEATTPKRRHRAKNRATP